MAKTKGPQVPETLYKAVYIGIFAFVLLYVFWGWDAIPERGLQLTPQMITAFLDDFAVIVGGIFVARRWKQFAFPEKEGEKVNVPAAAVYVTGIVIWLLYVFWVGDIIHDSTPYVGLFDDVAAFFLMMRYSHRIKRRVWGQD